MGEADIGDVLAELHRASALHAKPEVVHIRISPNAFPGSIVVVPIIGEAAEPHQRRGIRDPREVVIHPDDWRTIKQSLPRITGGRASPDGQVTALVGLPVIEP